MLRLTSFSFAADSHNILENITFSINKGEYLSVIGPNGAGKSTLLKCLMRVCPQGRARGDIRVKDRPLAAYDQRSLATVMAYVPQAGGWVPPFTVEELLRLSRYPYVATFGVLRKTDIAAVQRALRLTGMEALATRRMPTLSGGERQKAFLAAALAQETEVLLLDEPASFLDPKHTVALHRLIRGLKEEHGMTIMTVTHDLNHALGMGGKVLVLREGRQLFFGPAEDLQGVGVLEEAFGHSFLYVRHPKTEKPVLLAED